MHPIRSVLKTLFFIILFLSFLLLVVFYALLRIRSRRDPNVFAGMKKICLWFLVLGRIRIRVRKIWKSEGDFFIRIRSTVFLPYIACKFYSLPVSPSLKALQGTLFTWGLTALGAATALFLRGNQRLLLDIR